jgi:HlyD family secretion protein
VSRRWWWLPVLALAAGAALVWRGQDPPAQQRYRTQAVDRGDVVQAISANGTLNPVTLVQVGTQVSGTVQKIYADFNDQVSAGQVLAELDPSLLAAKVKQSEAGVQNAEATLALARSTLKRNQSLAEKKLISGAELETAEEQVKVAAAQVKLAEAQLEHDRTNLRYSVIRSPIAGVVVARNVDIGQTVAASFQTPTLFQIAQDLREMQIDTSVAEADVGALQVGQTVRFTVDAFPERTYEGRIRQVRLNPTIQQNVVTYNVVVVADNREGRLMPGMTAHVVIPVAERRGVLRVPNAALSFRPKPEEVGAGVPSGPPAAAGEGATVYVLERGTLRPVRVRAGITDNTLTEVVEGDLKPGDAVVTRAIAARQEAGGSGFRIRVM